MSACPVVTLPSDPVPFFSNGQLNFKAHDVGWIICSFLATISCSISIWLINKHLRNYTEKAEQRLIVRLLFMVPLYSITTLLSYIFYAHATSIVLFRDSYESILLVSFFYLLILYLGDSEDDRRSVFLTMDTADWRWIWPCSAIRWRPMDGSQFLYLMKWGVLQYCILQPLTSLLAVILNWVGLYCEDSWALGWGHIYITAIQTVSVTIAMYTLLQLYVVLSPLLREHSPLLKFLAVKSVVFLEFWQGLLLSGLQDFDVIKDTQYMTADEINVGISALLQTFEMVLIALLHIKAYSYRPYRLGSGETTPRGPALLHVIDFRDLLEEVWKGMTRFARKGQDREMDLWKAMGKRRGRSGGEAKDVWAGVKGRGDEGERQPTLPMLRADRGGEGLGKEDVRAMRSAGRMSESEQPTLPYWILDELTVPLSSFRGRHSKPASYAALPSLDDAAPDPVLSSFRGSDSRYPAALRNHIRSSLPLDVPEGACDPNAGPLQINGHSLRPTRRSLIPPSRETASPSSSSQSSLGYPLPTRFGPIRPARMSIPAPLSPARYPAFSSAASSCASRSLPQVVYDGPSGLSGLKTRLAQEMTGASDLAQSDV